MSKHMRWALGIVVLVAVAAVTASAMAFAGRGAGAHRPDNSKARTPSASVDEALRLERRDSFRNTGCSKDHAATLGV
jgi:hypothetical protein